MIIVNMQPIASRYTSRQFEALTQAESRIRRLADRGGDSIPHPPAGGSGRQSFQAVEGRALSNDHVGHYSEAARLQGRRSSEVLSPLTFRLQTFRHPTPEGNRENFGIFALQESGNATHKMNITLNNEPLNLDGESVTVEKLLELKKYTFKLRIVKINGRIIDRDSYRKEVINDGDTVQVIYLMSGG